MSLARRSRISEGSCCHCRKRRLRCDLGEPSCGRCQKDKQQCSYETGIQIKWVGGMATRGKLGPSSPDKAFKQSSPQSYMQSPPPSPPAMEPDLILYFNNVVIPRFMIPERQSGIDLDAVLQNKPLQQAILAVSQAHYTLNYKVDTTDIVLVRKRTRHAAIESFRQLLDGGVTSESSAKQLFTVNVLLCILDGIIEPSEEFNASMCHLKGGFAILDRWSHTTSRMLLQDGLEPHLLSIFATMDLVHAMLSGEKPFFEPLSWLMFSSVQTWWGCSSPDDPFLVLLKAFSEMAAMGSLVHSSLPVVENLPLVERCLSAIEHSVLRHQMPNSSTTDMSSARDWHTFCMIYQYCGLIYAERALRLRPVDHDIVQQITRRAVEVLIDDVLPGMMSHCLIFPILVLGVHCLHSQDRRAILSVLSPSSSYLSFGSLPLMVDFLQEFWRSGDKTSNWWETFSKVSHRAFFF